MSGGLTTHVLDVSAGKPAAGMKVQLWRLGAAPMLLKETSTNADGRLERALLSEDEMESGVYELIFEAGDYFHSTVGAAIASELFLDRIPVRFRITDSNSHYHVPLLVAPGGYSTYRGS
ncbi:hydroxyisourate hydrolase [Cohnella faecalis]|uniref:hydroxyisourate hydrolase n=1 Tax=Cohnella faecalis TaxID=2315694 RepID=UPI003623E6C6